MNVKDYQKEFNLKDNDFIIITGRNCNGGWELIQKITKYGDPKYIRTQVRDRILELPTNWIDMQKRDLYDNNVWDFEWGYEDESKQ